MLLQSLSVFLLSRKVSKNVLSLQLVLNFYFTWRRLKLGSLIESKLIDFKFLQSDFKRKVCDRVSFLLNQILSKI